MMRQAMRMPVDDPRDACIAERRCDGTLLDVHDRFGLGGGAHSALPAQQVRHAAAQRIREREE
jgi:hypothetical protein